MRFEVQGLGFKVGGSGFRVWGFFRSQGSGFRLRSYLYSVEGLAMVLVFGAEGLKLVVDVPIGVGDWGVGFRISSLRIVLDG